MLRVEDIKVEGWIEWGFEMINLNWLTNKHIFAYVSNTIHIHIHVLHNYLFQYNVYAFSVYHKGYAILLLIYFYVRMQEFNFMTGQSGRSQCACAKKREGGAVSVFDFKPVAYSVCMWYT